MNCFFNEPKTLSFDLSGTGTTAAYDNNQIEFIEFKNENWQEQLKFIVEIVKQKQPQIILYEHTNYLHQGRGKHLTSLFKLFGAIETLRYVFSFIQEINYIPVNQVKNWYKKALNGEKLIECLTSLCQEVSELL